jgi:hypothetical protein
MPKGHLYRRFRKLSKILAKERKTISLRKIALAHGITTPKGAPNKRLVSWMADGYMPKRIDTLRRSGLLTEEPPVIRDEPRRRVLIGAWRKGRRWVSPEEYFGARS